jgi:hypothetical protein
LRGIVAGTKTGSRATPAATEFLAGARGPRKHKEALSMSDSNPIDAPFLVFVVIASIALVGLCIAIYPH